MEKLILEERTHGYRGDDDMGWRWSLDIAENMNIFAQWKLEDVLDTERLSEVLFQRP